MEKTGKKIKLDKNIDLKSDFSAPSFNEWEEIALKSLKGASFDKILKTETDENIQLNPVYVRDDIKQYYENITFPGSGNFIRGIEKNGYIENGWDICQRMGTGLPEEFNQSVKEDLSVGQTSIFLDVDVATGKGIDPSSSKPGEVAVDGLSITTIDDIRKIFRDIEIKDFPVVFDADDSALEMLMMLNGYCNEKKIDVSGLSGALNFDPIASLAKSGMLSIPIRYLYDNMAIALKWAEHNKSELKITGVSTLPYHNSGASSVQEIAIALSTGVDYIDEMKKRGISVNFIAGSLVFRFGIGSDFFMEVAKLRASRVLWNKIVEAYGGEKKSRKMFIHGETSTFNQTKYDPYVNMLRTTTEAFSALAGGVNRLTTNTFDLIYGPPDNFSRRNARNVQMILKEESHLDKIIDPAAGSYYVEKLTDEIIKKSWELFLEIEEKGGVKKGLKTGFIQQLIEKTAKLKGKNLSKQKRILVGTNMYSNIGEGKIKRTGQGEKELLQKRVEEIAVFKEDPLRSKLGKEFEKILVSIKKGGKEIIDLGSLLFEGGATLQEVKEAFHNKNSFLTEKTDKLETKRLAHIFEKIRGRVASYNSLIEEDLTVTIAVFGPPAKMKPRADFTRNFFEVAGIKSELLELKGNAEDMALQLLKTEPLILVLCTADSDYPELIPELLPRLKEKTIEPVLIMAGNPGDKKKEFNDIGIDFFIFRGVDIARILTQILDESGVKNG